MTSIQTKLEEIKKAEELARETYWELCPHAPRDLELEKSTTMRAYVKAFTKALDLVAEMECDSLQHGLYQAGWRELQRRVKGE